MIEVKKLKVSTTVPNYKNYEKVDPLLILTTPKTSYILCKILFKSVVYGS